MENGQLHDDKLFRAVHDRLSDYEAPSEGADWDAMSRSLDALPKAARFQWKISLNSILVLVGVLGISALGFAIANHSGKSDSSTTVPVVAKENTVQPSTSIAVSNPATTTSTVPSNTTPLNNTTAMENSSLSNNTAEMLPVTSTDGIVKTRGKNKTNLRFGDQIDPKKGFIYNTHENNNVVTLPIVDPNPNLFYDAENGNVKRVEIKNDSSKVKPTKNHKTSSDSITGNTPTVGVPVDGDQQGFGGDGN